MVGVTQPILDGDYGLAAYLEQTDQEEFLDALHAYTTWTPGTEPLDPLCLVSFYAKLCYKSLVEGKNANVTKIREIEENLKAVLASGHGSVFEHVWINFVTTDCSRVFTHELVRHRVGTAFSQTSGRYVSIEDLDMVLPEEITEDVEANRITLSIVAQVQNGLRALRRALIKPDMDFAKKKKLTSAIRRLAPNGQTNEIGWSVNVRALRHLIQLRTSRHAEWEIRLVFNEVAEIVLNRWPMMLHGYKTENIDGMLEYTGLHV